MSVKELFDDLTSIYKKLLELDGDLAVDLMDWRDKWEPILAKVLPTKLDQELIQKATQAPISVDDLSSIKSASRDEALFRLYQLEKEGVFRSSLESDSETTFRVFYLVQSPIPKKEEKK